MTKLTTAFLKALENEMNTIVEANETVQITEVHKNNGIIFHGVSVSRIGHSCAPTIYVEQYVTDDTNLNAIHEIARDIYGTAKAHATESDKFDKIAEVVMDFKAIKDKIFPRLVNCKANEELLKTLVYTSFMDLAIIYAININSDENGVASIKITKQMLEKWGISENILHNQAMINMNIDGACCQSMMEMLMGMAPGEDFSFMKSDEMPMYVITNHNKVNGAVYLLCENLMQTIADKMRTNKIYMLPSSVHEVIIVPARNADIEALTQMVVDVNTTQLSPEEVLGDHAYIWKNGKWSY